MEEIHVAVFYLEWDGSNKVQKLVQLLESIQTGTYKTYQYGCKHAGSYPVRIGPEISYTGESDKEFGLYLENLLDGPTHPSRPIHFAIIIVSAEFILANYSENIPTVQLTQIGWLYNKIWDHLSTAHRSTDSITNSFRGPRVIPVIPGHVFEKSQASRHVVETLFEAVSRVGIPESYASVLNFDTDVPVPEIKDILRRFQIHVGK